MPRKMQIKSIKMLLERNYKIESDLIDIHAEVDKSLSYRENWRNIKRKYVEKWRDKDE